MHSTTWNVDASQILSRQEFAAVLNDLKRRAARLPNVQMHGVVVRLACCCGLRASDIGGLTLGDKRVGIARPHLLVRAEHAKLNRPRRVPLWWDAGTLADLSAWLNYRYERTAGATIRLSARSRRRPWTSR
jgi:integrase